jgi:ATP-dependent RNA helicase DDX35
LQTDILLGLLKKIIKKRPTLRLVIASATLDAVAFKDFFELTPSTNTSTSASTLATTDSSSQVTADLQSKETACIVNIPGRMFPVDCLYLETPSRNYLDTCVSTVLSIHRNGHIGTNDGGGDILVFLPGGASLS